MEVVDLQIATLAYGGKGVARLDGKAVFVSGAAPGDLLRCRLTREKARYAEAEIVELLAAGPQRCAPICPVFGDCGGCQWQHLDYVHQVAWKQTILSDILQRQASVPAECLRPLAASPEPFGYRNRVQFKCRAMSAGVAVGFFRAGSHYVVDIESCPIADPRLNALIPWIRQLVERAPHPDRIPQVDAGVDDAGRIRVVVHSIAAAGELWCRQLAKAAEESGYALYLQQGRKQSLRHLVGEELLLFQVGNPPLQLGYGPGGFAQVHSEQNRALVAEVVTAAKLQGRERVLDLYCGMGNFSLPLAAQCREVVGLESYAPSIAMARRNAEVNRLENTRFLARPAESAAGSPEIGRDFDLVVLDPPRTGAYPLMRTLLDLRPAVVIYVSCDPMTLARDLRPLLQGGYRLRYVRGFDLFPQTYHVETLAVLDLQQ